MIFSDESKINLINSDGARYVRYLPINKHETLNILPTVKHSEGSVMIWGVISYYSVLDLVFIEDKITDEQYKTI
ncbi:TC1A [Hepatospora eriocheir]|uniref:TC1A n=1 Tax=Hepatospora eriocheir TaxID=1081669 RepID=A0A1X0QGW6_9MICR|nr:TC1A [Hepatospora eriocheir]